MKAKASSKGKAGQEKILRAGPTRPWLVALAVVGSMALWLLLMGLRNLRIFPPAGGWDATIPMAVVPLGMALLLLGLVFWPFLANRGIVISVRKDGLRFSGRGIYFDADWGRLTYMPPGPGRKGFRTLTLGTREIRVRVDEIFLPGFEDLAAYLDKVMARIDRSSPDGEEI